MDSFILRSILFSRMFEVDMLVISDQESVLKMNIKIDLLT